MLRLNHWWQMDYFDDVFHTFLGLDIVNCLPVNGSVTSLLGFIQNISNCVLRTNKDCMGLEWRGGKVINDNIFILGWSNPLKSKFTCEYLCVHNTGAVNAKCCKSVTCEAPIQSGCGLKRHVASRQQSNSLCFGREHCSNFCRYACIKRFTHPFFSRLGVELNCL